MQYHSVVTVLLSAMTCLNLDEQYWKVRIGLGVGLEEAVEIRNILIFRYMCVIFGISFGLSIVRSGSGPARPGPARPVMPAARPVPFFPW
jgi:hypothetical protein